MSKKSFYRIFTVITIVALSQSITSAQAENKGKGNSKSEMSVASASPSAGVITTSTWISPNFPKTQSTPAPTAIYVNPGSSIPLKFKLFNGGTEVKSTQGVSITTEAVACVGISPSPTPSNLGIATPGKSEKSNSNSYSLKYNPSGFSAVWKSSKNASGCFKFKVTYATGTLNSPTIIFAKK